MTSKARHIYNHARFNARRWLPVADFPAHVDIELAARCNLRCIMCPYGTEEFNQGLQGMMSVSMASEAIRQAAAGGVTSIKFNFRGEPGLNQNLGYAIQLAKSLGHIETMINTNLLAFSRRKLQNICDSGLDLAIVSVDGATKETYEQVRVGGEFEHLMRNLKCLSEMHPRPRIRVQMTVQDANRHEVPLAKQLFGPLCDQLSFRQVSDRGGGEGRTADSGERRSCGQPRQRLVVAWDGKVFGCCSNWANENPIGQFPEQSLAEIWHGLKMSHLRETAKDPVSGWPCATCTVSDSFK